METTLLKRPEGFRELTGFFFLLKGLNNFLIVLLTSLFLKDYGAAGLPWFYVLVNILFISSQMIMMRHRSWAGFGFLSFFSRPLILAVVVMAVIAQSGHAGAIFGALLFVTVYDFHATQAFSDLSGHVLPLREAKVHLSTVWAAGTAGSILSGLTVRFVVDALGFAWTFLGAAALLFLSDRLLKRLGAIISEQESATIKSRTQSGHETALPECVSWNGLHEGTRKFSRLLIGLSFSAIFGRILMDFLYNSQMVAAFPSAVELAGFLGLFWAAIDVTALLLQTLTARWVFSNLRLGTIVATRAVVLTIVALIGAWLPGPVTAAAGWLALMTMTKAFINPGLVLMLEPIPKHSRVMIRRYIGIADSLANMSAGLLLLFLKAGGGKGNESVIFLFVAMLFGGSLFVTRFLDDWYSQTVEETLQHSDVEGDVEIIHALRFVAPVERQSRMARLLQHHDSDVRLRTILETAELPPEQTADLLLTALINEKEPRNVTAMVRTILMRLGPMGEELIEDLLQHEEDPRLVADIIESLHSGENERITRLLPVFLSHDNHRVRGNAVKTLLRRSEERPILTRCLEMLQNLLSSTIDLERATAAVVMGSAGLPVFVPALGFLADDDQAEVSGHACRALARIGNAQAVRVLAEKRIRGRHPEQAHKAWEELHRKGLEERDRLLAGLSSAERSRIGFWLKAVQSAADEEMLLRVLRVRDADKREVFLRALGEGDPETRELIGACLRLVGAETQLEIEPLLERLQSHNLDRFPAWGDLVIPLGGSRHSGYEELLIGMLARIARETLVFERAVFIGILKPGTETEQLKVRLDQRLRVAIHFAALAGKQPAETLDALVKATTRDKFVHSVALEFLEEQLGRNVARSLFPLLEVREPSVRQAQLAMVAGVVLETLDAEQMKVEVRVWLAEPGP